MGRLIINADDFGYDRGVNTGIIEAFNEGVVTSTTLMATMPGFDEAIELAKKNPKLGIGVHLTLTCGYSVGCKYNTIIDKENKFLKLLSYENEEFVESLDLNEIYEEWNLQINKIIKAGIIPSHLDSHHHVNSIGNIKDVYLDLSKKYDLPVRNNFSLPKEIKTTDKLVDFFDKIGSNKKIWRHMDINNLIKDCLTYDSIEVMCHPAYVDYFLLKNSSFNIGRVNTLNELKNKEIKKIFKENNINLINFKNL
ncbi:carbohydrate deacetylase [Anaerococcus sp. AGMB00486]|uniref:Carbohydrate deacetylase n=1 Tax=Anaerococcus faecalis TaxID=2742993 RepID=A0ABX2NAU5_9FIRM|nr:carbohydrate deacetylase [Anaerococcus faecalis]NVF11813.1 carbohydrate deacetylase [Anaerococcus faecalis]